MPTTRWDEGTAYDFFVSLFVLHRPEKFGLRPSWAAGVRSRLPAPQRDFLEKVQSFLPVPLCWLYLLPAEAKNVAGALHTLAQTPITERLPSLLFTADTPIEVFNALNNVTLHQTWSSAEQEILRTALMHRGIPLRPNTVNNLCEVWCDLTDSGERYLQALQAYYEVFFKQEEERIAPAVINGLRQAQQLASTLPMDEILDRLSHGVHFEQIETVDEVILVPSYWASPLVFYNRIHPHPRKLVILFGSRPETDDLISGESFPSDLVKRMKAIADPTRLRILRYLAQGPLSPSELSQLLRLRPPTVVHHLNELRLAGLVEIILHADGERGYNLRRAAVEEALRSLTDFLQL
jgi:DNA-binding transcriptional ArsR family regulator